MTKVATSSRTNLGKYLYSERIRRGYESISKYIDEYNLTNTISESYYRDLETGRKIARIETGIDLCKSLDLKQQDFFYHLLKDILPEEVFKTIIKPSQQAVFETVSDEIERLSIELDSLRKAYGKTLAEDPFQVDDNDVDYLSENFYLLPIIHYIYMRRSCSFDDIQEIINKNDIRKDLNFILSELKHRMWAVVDEKQRIVIRHKRNFRIPRTPKGFSLKDRFLLHEAKLSMEDDRRDGIVSPNNTFQHSSIFCVSPKKGGERIADKVAELTALFSAGEIDLEDKDAVPFFFSIMISSREIYDTKKHKRSKKR